MPPDWEVFCGNSRVGGDNKVSRKERKGAKYEEKKNAAAAAPPRTPREIMLSREQNPETSVARDDAQGTGRWYQRRIIKSQFEMFERFNSLWYKKNKNSDNL